MHKEHKQPVFGEIYRTLQGSSYYLCVLPSLLRTPIRPLLAHRWPIPDQHENLLLPIKMWLRRLPASAQVLSDNPAQAPKPYLLITLELGRGDQGEGYSERDKERREIYIFCLFGWDPRVSERWGGEDFYVYFSLRGSHMQVTYGERGKNVQRMSQSRSIFLTKRKRHIRAFLLGDLTKEWKVGAHWKIMGKCQ